jgi:hypothetical protein
MLRPVLKQLTEDQYHAYVLLLTQDEKDLNVRTWKVGVLTGDVYDKNSNRDWDGSCPHPCVVRHKNALEFHDAEFEVLAINEDLEQALLRMMKMLGEPFEYKAVVEDKLRHAIVSRDGGKCVYCGKRATLADHIIPRAIGGNDDPTNLVAACWHCNTTKCDANWRLWYQAQRCYDKAQELYIEWVLAGKVSLHLDIRPSPVV